MSLTDKTLYEFGRFQFDPADRLLLEDGRPVALTPKALEILLILVQNGSRLTTKEELMRKVWPDSFVEEANLTVNISALRKILGETSDGGSHIETVPKSGYRFVAAVRELQDEHRPSQGPSPPGAMLNSGSTDVPEDSGSPAVKSKYPSSRWLVLTTAFLILAIAAISYVVYRRQSPHGHATAVNQPRRLAILPFQNLRDDRADDFLGFSLADAAITKLGYVSTLVVRPSYAVQKYTAHPVDLQRVASELNVDT